MHTIQVVLRLVLGSAERVRSEKSSGPLDASLVDLSDRRSSSPGVGSQGPDTRGADSIILVVSSDMAQE